VPGQQETLRAAIKRSEEKSERATFLIAKVVRMKIRKKKKKRSKPERQHPHNPPALRLDNR
jgi:hypothetical protein